MNIAILGYGAVGKSLTNVFSESNNKISVFSSGKYLEKNNKFLVSQFPIESFSRDLNTQDIIILTTKNPNVTNYIDIVTKIIGKNSLILPMQNGFYSYELYKKIFFERTLASSISIVTNISKNKLQNNTKKPTISFVRPVPVNLSKTFNKFIESSEVLLNFEIFEDENVLLWRKFTRIVALSLSCIYFQSNLGEILTNEQKFNFLKSILLEMKNVAFGYGVLIDIDQELKRISTISPKLKTSLFHSLENKNSGEYEYLISEAIKKAKFKNIKIEQIEYANKEIYKRYTWL
tara:strand:+ start:198 stop:1067 length:870 start_codon:yes stop_codon:yes gene_type:complete